MKREAGGMTQALRIGGCIEEWTEHAQVGNGKPGAEHQEGGVFQERNETLFVCLGFLLEDLATCMSLACVIPFLFLGQHTMLVIATDLLHWRGGDGQDRENEEWKHGEPDDANRPAETHAIVIEELVQHNGPDYAPGGRSSHRRPHGEPFVLVEISRDRRDRRTEEARHAGAQEHGLRKKELIVLLAERNHEDGHEDGEAAEYEKYLASAPLLAVCVFFFFMGLW